MGDVPGIECEQVGLEELASLRVEVRNSTPLCARHLTKRQQTQFGSAGWLKLYRVCGGVIGAAAAMINPRLFFCHLFIRYRVSL